MAQEVEVLPCKNKSLSLGARTQISSKAEHSSICYHRYWDGGGEQDGDRWILGTHWPA